MRRFSRAILIGAAVLATAYWLLHDSTEQGASTASTPAARAQGSPSEPTASPALDFATNSAPPAPAVAEAPPGPSGELSPAEQPIPVIGNLLLPGGMWTLHTRLEREPRDPNWSTLMELQFANYFASKPELASKFGLPSVVCRQSACEIQAIGYGPQAFATWSSATADLRDQQWAKELRAGGIYTTEIAPNEQGVVLILWRTRVIQRLGSVQLVLE